MGMTKASLDFQIQQSTQQAIATLQKNIERLDGICRIIDGNMRQSHAIMYQDIMQLRVRVNFLMGELKNGTTEADALGLEERFKEFAKGEALKMEKDVSEAIAAREKAQDEAEAAKKAVDGSYTSRGLANVIQG